MDSAGKRKSPILHVIVVGFHHKKGCQLEYSYPPLIDGQSVESHELPQEWKHLPSMALPDGAHNYEKDTVFFHLTSRDGSSKTVYGISCYQQIDAQELLNKTADVTRSTVQKAVCVLSTMPLFGVIKAKLQMITHVYFNQRDFTTVSLLEETYNNLVACVQETSVDSQVFVGLSVRDVILRYRYKIVMLFKLLMLERKVLFFMNPVEKLTSTVLAMLSLFPGMLEHGLDECTSYSHKQLPSPTVQLHEFGQGESGEYVHVNMEKGGTEQQAARENGAVPEKCEIEVMEKCSLSRENSVEQRSAKKQGNSQERCRQMSSGSTKSITISENEINVTDLPEVFHTKTGHHKDKQEVGQQHNGEHGMVSKVKSNKSDSSVDKSLTPRASDSSIHSTGHEHYPGHVEKVCLEKDAVSAVGSADGVFWSCDGDLSQDQEEVKKQPDLVLDLERVSKGSSGIPEIDSPEGISEIDAEDRFQWGKESQRLAMLSDSEPSDGENKILSLDSFSDSLEVNKDSGEGSLAIVGDDIKTGEVTTVVNENFDAFGHEDSGVMKSRTVGSMNSVSVEQVSQDEDLVKRKSKEGTPERIAKTAQEVKERITSALTKKKSTSVEFLARIDPTGLCIDSMGMPLAIFTKGSLCHPYIALQQYDLVENMNVRSFVIGATNILFKQRKHLTEAVIGEDELHIEIRDTELKKQLHLTTADLRFADHLVKNVQADKDDVFMEGTEWEGGDEWLRSQFRHYLVSLLSAVLQDDEKTLEDFNMNFVNSWKLTHNYIVWRNTLQEIKDVQVGHPFHGQLNLSDMKLRLSTSMQGTERGRKINAAVTSTGRAVAETGKAVGGALNQAKSVVSSWFSSFGSKNEAQEAKE